MSLYYVYLRFFREDRDDSVNFGRYLLTCASRDHADQYFRALQSYLTITRITPQFWQFSRLAGENTVHQLEALKLIPLTLRPSIIISELSWTAERAWTWLSAPVQSGRDWINNRSYYIRNVRQPEIYWFHPGGGDNRILASRWQKTRFFVHARVTGSDAPTVLVGSDEIRLSTDSSGADLGLFVRQGDNNKLVTQATNESFFAFGNLRGTYGTSWEVRDGEPHEFVTWSERGDLDDWELC